MNIELKIGNLPLSYNQVVKFSGWRRQEYRDEWYEEVKAAWLVWRNEHSLPDNLPFQKAQVIFTVYFSDKRHHDHINTAGGLKFALDSLTTRGIGVIQDDQWYPVRKVNDFYIAAYDKLFPRTEILISKAESVSEAVERMLAEAVRLPTKLTFAQEETVSSGNKGIPGQMIEVGGTK